MRAMARKARDMFRRQREQWSAAHRAASESEFVRDLNDKLHLPGSSTAAAPRNPVASSY